MSDCEYVYSKNAQVTQPKCTRNSQGQFQNLQMQQTIHACPVCQEQLVKRTFHGKVVFECLACGFRKPYHDFFKKPKNKNCVCKEEGGTFVD